MGFDQFMKKNQKIDIEEVEYAATKSLCDENGEPLKWRFRRIPSKVFFQVDTKDVNGEAKTMICRSCVCPNLRDRELQDSYGVKRPEDLLVEMVPDLGEMARLSKFVVELNALDMNAEIEEAKN